MRAVTELDSCPTLVPDWENEALEQALQSIAAYTVGRYYTSPNGVEIFFQALQKRKIDIRTLAQLRFAVIGTGTAAALEKRDIIPPFCPNLRGRKALRGDFAAWSVQMKNSDSPCGAGFSLS